MKAAIIAVLGRSPWALLGIAVMVLLALWLVLSRSYSLRVQGGDMRLELAPASASPR